MAAKKNTPKLLFINSNQILWKINVPDQECYMCLNNPRTDHSIVYVDTECFYKVWYQSGIDCTDEYFLCPEKSEMPNDSKYKWAIDGFKKGIKNPVPLAQPNGYLFNGKPRINFVDGITRTLWLIYNQAESFPIRCPKPSAEFLNKIVGMTEKVLNYTDLSS